MAAASEDANAAKGKSKGRGKGRRPKIWRVIEGTNGVAVRRRPAPTAQVIDSMVSGSYVPVVGRHEDWLRLHASAGYGTQAAWMHTSSLEKQEVQAWRVTSRGKVPVREERSFSSRVLGIKLPGSIVKVSYFEGHWARMHSMQTAWIFKDDLDQQVQMDPQQKASRRGRVPGKGGACATLALEDESSSEDDLACAEADAAPVEGEAAPTMGDSGSVQEDPARESEEQAAASTGDAGSLQQELARVSEAKALAVEAEDYDRAFELKERQRELQAQLESLAAEADAAEAETAAAAAGAAAARRRDLEEELASVRVEKSRAVEEEDFGRATELKRRQQALEAELEGLA